MKKKRLLSHFLIFNLLLTLVACKKKEDRIDPVLTLLGDSLIYLDSTLYVEYGATANDAEDGELVPVITNLINLEKLNTGTS